MTGVKMNDHLKSFYKINQSVEQLLKSKHHSSEVKQSAINLRKSMQPCLAELRQSAARIKDLLKAGFDDLDHAEDVWHSKPKIARVATDEIWQQLEQLRKDHCGIRLLGSQCKREAVKQAQACWKQILEPIEAKWFLGQGSQAQTIVGKDNKNNFTMEIRSVVASQFQEIIKIIKRSLDIVYKKLANLHLDYVFQYVIFLDKRARDQARTRINLILNEINAKFRSLILHSPCQSRNLLEFNNPFKPAVQFLLNPHYNDIDWQNFCRFKKEVYTKIIEVINTIIEDRINLAIKSIEQVILFYTDFLERQYRYQQETPQQRNAEKAWIDQQRQQLERVSSSIDAILAAPGF
ncbi:MAG: hypothetical protein F6J92_10225 [Symploca sp. SIO1A3]|nr:hypothetical protein [Symploca sp. SIO1A3]